MRRGRSELIGVQIAPISARKLRAYGEEGCGQSSRGVSSNPPWVRALVRCETRSSLTENPGMYIIA